MKYIRWHIRKAFLMMLRVVQHQVFQKNTVQYMIESISSPYHLTYKEYDIFHWKINYFLTIMNLIYIKKEKLSFSSLQ